MSLIDKAYFTLEEIEERWRLPHRDVVYLAENGLLKLSVRLFHVHLEWGAFEEMPTGDWARSRPTSAGSAACRILPSTMPSAVPGRRGGGRSVRSAPPGLLPPAGADREHNGAQH
jgi:hypothetical protein